MCLEPETIYRLLQCAAAHISCTEGRSGWLTAKLKHQQWLTAHFFSTDSRWIISFKFTAFPMSQHKLFFSTLNLPFRSYTGYAALLGLCNHDPIRRQASY